MAAMRQVLAESKRTGAVAQQSFGGFATQLQSITKLLGALGIVVGVSQLVGEIRQLASAGLQASTELDRLRQLTGSTIVNLQALSLAAARNDVDLEMMRRAVVRFAVNLQGFKEGTGSAGAAFRAFGLTARDFKGKDVAESMEITARAVVKFGAGVQKTADFSKIFGVRMTTLMPVMQDLGVHGFAAMRQEGERLGVLMSDDIVNSAHRLAAELHILNFQITSVTIRVLGAMAPAIITALRGAEGEIGRNADMWEKWGNSIGKATAHGIVNLSSFVDNAVGMLQIIYIMMKASYDMLDITNKKSIGTIAKEAMAAKNAIDAGVIARDKIRAETNKEIEAPGSTRKGWGSAEYWSGIAASKSPTSLHDMDEATSTALALADARIEARLRIRQEELKSEEAANQRAYDNGLISLRDFYAERLRIVNAGYEAEKQAIIDKRAAADKEGTQKASLLAAKEKGDLGVLEIKHQKDIADLAHQEAKEYGIVEVAKRHIDELDRSRAVVNERMAAGLMSQVAGTRAIRDIERSRLPVLRLLSEEQMRQAIVSGDPVKIMEAQRTVDSVNQVSLALQAQDDIVGKLGVTLVDSGQLAFEQFMTSSELVSGRVGAAFAGMASTVLKALDQMIAKFIAFKIVSGILSLFPGGSKMPAGSYEAGVPRAAEGGQLFGPGSSRYGPGLLMYGHPEEFVVKAAAVRRAGVLAHLQALNRGVSLGSLPSFAEGGLLGLSTPSIHAVSPPRLAEGTLSAARASIDGHFTLGLEPGLVEQRAARWIAAPEGSKVLVRTVAENRGAILRVLGLS
jgi:hypothetical protein